MREASHGVVELCLRDRDGLDGKLRLGLRKPDFGVLGQNAGIFRATFVEEAGAVVGASRSALEAAIISGVSSTFVMSKETKSLERANKISKEI